MINRLHLGCGANIKEGWINLDFSKAVGVDLVHNLDKFPYPFKDNSFEEILMQDVLEHLENTERALEELYRISKNRAKIKITVPHHAGGNAYLDITHKKFFNSCLFKNIADKGEQNIRLNANKFKFKVNKIYIHLQGWCKIFEKLINRHKGFYDYSLCYILRPSHIEVELEVIKS